MPPRDDLVKCLDMALKTPEESQYFVFLRENAQECGLLYLAPGVTIEGFLDQKQRRRRARRERWAKAHQQGAEMQISTQLPANGKSASKKKKKR